MSLRVIIAGAGRAGAELHLRAYRKTPGVEVVAICDLDLERASRVAQAEGVSSAYASVTEAMQAHEADILSICTPPSTHFELAREALEGGLNVLVEKPIFQSLEEADAIGELLEGRDVTLSAVHNQKYLPGLLEARRRVDAGEAGEIRHAQAVWMVDGTEDRMISDPDFWCHQLSGGRWEEMVAHPIYKAHQFLGPLQLRNVEAKTTSGRWPWLSADEVSLSFEGERGYFDLHLSANLRKYNYMLLYGTQKILYVDSQKVVDLKEAVSGLVPSPIPSLPERLLRRVFPRRSSGGKDLRDHELLIRDFVAYVKKETPTPPVSWEEAYQTLRLVGEVGQGIERAAAGGS